MDGREGVLSGSVSMVKRRRNVAVVCYCCLIVFMWITFNSEMRRKEGNCKQN